jgi:hypothetical protein
MASHGSTGYRARRRQFTKNKLADRSGQADDLLPSAQFQKFANSPRVRTTLAAKLNVHPESLNEFTSDRLRPTYRKSIYYYPSITTDPTKANVEDRKASPTLVKHVYTVGTTTSNVPWTIEERKLAKEEDFSSYSTLTNFALGRSQNSVSPKTRQIRKSNEGFQPASRIEPSTTQSPTKPETNSTNRKTITFAPAYAESSATMVNRADNWPIQRAPISTVSCNGLHKTGEPLTFQDKMVRGQLHGEALTGGYTVSKDPIKKYRSKVQDDYVWPTMHESEWRKPQAGGLPCLFDMSAEHLKGFRRGNSNFEAMVNGGGGRLGSGDDEYEYEDKNDFYNRSTRESSANSSRQQYGRRGQKTVVDNDLPSKREM